MLDERKRELEELVKNILKIGASSKCFHLKELALGWWSLTGFCGGGAPRTS